MTMDSGRVLLFLVQEQSHLRVQLGNYLLHVVNTYLMSTRFFRLSSFCDVNLLLMQHQTHDEKLRSMAYSGLLA